MTMRCLGDISVEVILQHMVEMAEGFLLGDYGDMVTACKYNQFCNVRRCKRPEGRRR